MSYSKQSEYETIHLFPNYRLNCKLLCINE